MIHMIRGKTYMVGEKEGRHFFAWSTEGCLFVDELPTTDINNEKNGIKWFKTHGEAFDAYIDATKKEGIKSD